MLEKDVSELKAALAEANANNVALHNQVDQQKKSVLFVINKISVIVVSLINDDSYVVSLNFLCKIKPK